MTMEQYQIAKIMFAKGNSLTAISEKLSINRKNLSIQLKADNMYHGKGYSQDQLVQAKILVDAGHSFTSIGKIMKVNRQAIKEAIEQEVYSLNTSGTRKHSLNEDRFSSISTQDDAYWLGFLMADGYVYNHTSYIVELGLKSSDRAHLESFAKYMQSSAPIQDRITNLKGKQHKSSRISICSKTIVTNLDKLGCMQNKSLLLDFPVIPNELIPHYIRGYFDGDGCVYHRSDNQLEVSLIGTSQFLNKCADILLENASITSSKNFRKKGNAYTFRVAGNKVARRFYDYIYNDSTIWLDRKRCVFTAVLG